MKEAIKRALPQSIVPKIGVVTGLVRNWILRTFAKDFSQLGETVAVRRLMRGFPERTFVEVGANDGMTVSTTYGLVLDGWSGLSIEPNPRIYAMLHSNLAPFPAVKTVCCAASPVAGPVQLFLGKNDPKGLLSTL